MGRGFTLGQFLGIKVRVDWSWLLIFILISWNLGAVFGSMHPDWSPLLRWSMALTGSLLFFLSVLAHEFAHSLVARARGIPVRSITLFLFGGVANIQQEPKSPTAEFLITIVGPLTSFVIGILSTVAGSLLGAQTIRFTFGTPTAVFGQLSPLATVLLWLGSINILLAVFNLIPGFPLDGGRLLRSFLWAVTDNLKLATRWATRIGQGIAWLMIAGGIAMVLGFDVPFFGTGLSGLWLAFIGWFLHTAASQSYRQLLIENMLEDVSVMQLMRPNPTSVAATATIDSLVSSHLLGTDENAFPVVEDGRLVGLIRLKDILDVPVEARQFKMVQDIMTPIAEIKPLSPVTGADEALQQLQQRSVRQLPVMENGRLIGLLSQQDIFKWLQLQGATQ